MTDVASIDVAPHVPRMRRLALRMLGDEHDADDVVQEACLKAVRSQGAFAGRAQVFTWLHQIVTRCALDRIRQRQRHDKRAIVDGSAALAGVLAFTDDGPFALAERNELRAVVQAAIAELPDDCRDAFVLTQFDGCSYDDAAAILKLPRGTLASRVYRAKRILLERLAERWEGVKNDE